MKKTKTKAKPKKPVKKTKISQTSRKNLYVLFWTLLLFLLSLPILIFIRGQQDIRQRAASKQTTTAAACIPSGGTCKPVGNCGSAETDAGQKDCSSDGSLTCCIPQSVGCLGSTNCNTTPTPVPSAFPSTTLSNTPSQTPSNSPSQTLPNPSISANPSAEPSQVIPSLSITPGTGQINNNLLAELLNLIKQLLDFFSSLIGSIGGHHSGNNSGNHHSNSDKD